jgi:hypothetical protein
VSALPVWRRALCVGVLLWLGASSSPVAARTAPAPAVDGAAELAGFTARWNGERSALAVNPMIAAPGQVVNVQVEPGGEGTYTFDAGVGTLRRVSPAAWRWTAPTRPGAYTLEIARGDGARMRFTALVATPRSRVRRGVLNGYLIGDYPQSPAGQALYRAPEGFIEVDARSTGLPLTPHFTLGQFVCKQDARGARYVALRERLPLALEAAMDRLAHAGIASSGLTVMSGYRTPHYNRQLGDTRLSRHQFGDAADVFVDEDGDGAMDDLNADGRHDIGDARLMFDILDAAGNEVAWQRFRGGLAAYAPTPYHGAFVHIDTRGVKARW